MAIKDPITLQSRLTEEFWDIELFNDGIIRIAVQEMLTKGTKHYHTSCTELFIGMDDRGTVWDYYKRRSAHSRDPWYMELSIKIPTPKGGDFHVTE